MRLGPARKPALHLRKLGPYLLVELLLPGGTLVALLLWLTQRLRAQGIGAQRAFLRESLPRAAIAAKPHAGAKDHALEPMLALAGLPGVR